MPDVGPVKVKGQLCDDGHWDTCFLQEHLKDAPWS